MARPREFNVDQALDAALDVFWAKGYEATSLCDLLDAMDLSKSSLYDTFGSKHELYLKAIDRYVGERTEGHERAFLSAPSGRQAIEGAFRQIIDDATGKAPYQGCFAMNCAMERAQSDDEAAERVKQAFKRYQRNYEIVIRRAQAAGEIPASKDARALARFLTSSAHGLHVTAKANPDCEVLEDIVSTILEALD